MPIKYLFIFSLLMALVVVLKADIVYADLINPEYYSKSCPPGEVQVTCSYRSEQPFGPRTFDSCEKYKNDKNYYVLVGSGSSFGGQEKYCRKMSILNYITEGLVVLAVVSLSFLGLRRIRLANNNQNVHI